MMLLRKYRGNELDSIPEKTNKETVDLALKAVGALTRFEILHVKVRIPLPTGKPEPNFIVSSDAAPITVSVTELELTD
jgi:hypothetical protein